MEFVFDNNSTNNYSQPQGFAAEPLQSTAPSSIPRRSRRTLPTAVDEIGITGTRKKRAPRKASSKVKYVKAPKRRVGSTAKFEWTWQKFWWAIACMMFLRLLLMENGIVDYYKLESTIEDNHQKLALVKKENSELVAQIHKIQTSGKYQRKMARDHLGVIASNEYLILFSKDSH